MEGEKNFTMGSNYDKLIWLIKLRFFLILLIAILFILFIFVGNFFNTHNISPFIILLTNLAALSINVFLLLDLLYLTRRRHLIIDDDYFNYLGFIQIDFDIIYILSIIVITGGFESPFLLLLIYNIVTSTFIIPGKLTYIYSFLTLLLLFLTRIQLQGIPDFPYINIYRFQITLQNSFVGIIYIFAVYISKYVANKINEKQDELNILYERTYQLSITDRLTGLYDQTYFRIAAQDAIDIAKENNSKLAIVMIDLDNFKAFNDNNGHLLGSKALQDIADLMRTVFRKTDLKAKYGGDEFIILMRDIELEYVPDVINRFRDKLKNYRFSNNSTHYSITASIGISIYPFDGENISELIDTADKALYYIKNRGKNQLMFFYDIK